MLHLIKTEQLLQCDRQTAWKFMSDPNNLARITPAYMNFKVIRGGDPPTYAGQIIEYKVQPVLGIKLHWVTEITHVEEGHYFVDEQRFGPYAFWHHQHILAETPNGTFMKDLVHYKVRMGILGKAANLIFIRKQLDGIFAYRRQALDELFNKRARTVPV